MLATSAAAVVVLNIGSGGCARPICEPNALDGAVFTGTVTAVSDDGGVSLSVESVETVADRATVPPRPSDGATTAVPPSNVLAQVRSGATVTVVFPPVQVEHLRRDVGQRYRVVARLDQERTRLRAELQDIDVRCGQTTRADG